MNPDRFQDPSARQLVKVREGNLAYWAYVPHPLPPKIEPDWALTHILSEAERALGELAGVGRTMPNPHLLIGPFIRREAVLSSRIEGTRADVTDLYAYQAGQLSLPGMTPAPSEADVREVHNYVQALEYGLERLETLPVSLRLIREIHQHLLQGVRGERATPGEFRDRQNWLGRGDCTLEDATFVPPPVPQMRDALYALEEYLHSDDDYPPLVRLAMMHYQFEVIHPFIDGNGRVGRLLISLLLVKWGLLPQPLLHLSAFFFRHRQDYYDLLLAVSRQGGWTDWLSFFLRGVAEQSHDAVTRARRLQDLRADWHDQLTGTRVSALALQLVDHLFDSPVITIPQAQEALGVTYRTAQRHIQGLVDAGILHQAGDADYGRTFVAGEILAVLGADSV